MKQKLQTLALLLVAAGLVFFLYRHWFPNEEKRVRQTLLKLAEAASTPDRSGTLASLAAADRLRDYFTAEVEVSVEAPGEGEFHAVGRAEILQAALAARNTFKGLKVQFLDINVALAPDRQSATAELTARVTLKGEADFFVQELKLQLKQEDRHWRVAKAETVRTLKP